MKIVCDACSAKYSIADEKVQGKVFKIRCKKCSNIIVVRGTGGAEEAVAAPAAAAAPGTFDQKETRVYDYGGYDGAPPAEDGVWHIVVDQEQIGPLTVADVQARFAAGEIDGESYIWREGFADWQPLSQVADFASLVAGGSTTTAQPSSGQDAVASMFGSTNYDDPASGRGDPNDVFAAHAAQQDDGAGSADLFGQKAAAPRTSRRTDAPAPAEDAPLFGSAEVPRGAEPQVVSSMKGQRNENSVLFSLGNLAALASDQPRAPAASASSSAPGTAGHGGGEGSGLLDIRSMASAYLGGGAKPGMSPSGPKIGSADDLPVFSTAAFSEPAVIMPSLGGARNNNNKLMYVLLGAVALLAVVAVVLVVVVMGKKDTKSDAVAANGAAAKPSDPATPDKEPGVAAGAGDSAKPADPEAAKPDPDAAKPDPEAAKPDPEAAKPEPVKPEPVKPEPVKPEPVKPSSSSGSKPSGSSSGSKPSGSSSGSKPSGASKPDPAPSSGGSCLDEVSCMLAVKKPACCDRYGGGKKASGSASSGSSSSSSGGGGDLPDALTKSDISSGVAKIQSKASACGAKSSAKGSVKVSVKVASNGSVSSVTVKESPDPALGSCVAAAMQKATFTKTKSGGSFSYPFRF